MNYTQIVSRNGGECFIRKIDKKRLCINVNIYGTIIAISNNICQRIIYILGYEKENNKRNSFLLNKTNLFKSFICINHCKKT